MNQHVSPPSLETVLRADFGTFVAKVFKTVSPGDDYLHNWHIDAIVHELMRVHASDNRRLIVNQPPRSLKSICVSVAFTAWWLGHDPTRRFACVSYSNDLATALHRQFRAVVTSNWYRKTFPNARFTKVTENELETSRGGGRFATSIGGSITGKGFDVIIIDDPIKPEEAQSASARRRVIDYYRSTLVSRLDDQQTGALILVMQRLHEEDLTGNLLNDGGWFHLELPAIAQEDQKIAIGPDAFHHFEKGALLHPERMPMSVLDKLRAENGSLVFSAQFLQRPVPVDGNLIRREWFQFYDDPPARMAGTKIAQSWDVASTVADTSDYSVCTTWMIKGKDYYLLDVWRDRLEFPRLRQKAIELFRCHHADVVLIEKAGPGLQLFQEFVHDESAGIPRPIGIQPEGDKLVRMEAQSARFEAGQVHLPRKAPWLAEFVHELLAFPRAKHDDQIDSTAQFLKWAVGHRRNEPILSLFPPQIIRG